MTMESEEFVSLKQLAETIGLDRSNTRKYVLKLGIKPHKRRTSDSRNQLTLALTKNEAERIIGERETKGFTSSANIVKSETGVFYVIQLVPELDPRRIKLGFAINLNERLGQHKTAAPTATVLRSWPCRRAWELTVMDSLSDANCRLILNEVFECNDIPALLRRGDEIFALLPEPARRPDLSEHSPYATANGANESDRCVQARTPGGNQP